MKKLVECPNCGHKFEIELLDDSQIASIIADKMKEVNKENEKKFEEYKKTILESAKKDKEAAILKIEKEFSDKISDLQHENIDYKNNEKNLKKDFQFELQKQKDYIVEKITKDKDKEFEEKFEKYTKNLQNEKQDLVKEVNGWKKKYEDEISFKKSSASKLLGEQLETWCENKYYEVEKDMFPYADFYKDNTPTGSNGEKTKGDFIFKDYLDENKEHEFISIMFEMKNQGSTGKTKNRDYYERLNKNRNEKKCKYAVLVSELELEVERFDHIFQVKDYPNMYVIRPNDFIPFIRLLRNNELSFANERALMLKEQKNTEDINNFIKKFEEGKDAVYKNFSNSAKHYAEAIKYLENTIRDLVKTRKSMITALNQIQRANDKLNGMTIRKLTHGLNSEIQKYIKDAYEKYHSEPAEVSEVISDLELDDKTTNSNENK